jgi:hypothetical protein
MAALTLVDNGGPSRSAGRPSCYERAMPVFFQASPGSVSVITGDEPRLVVFTGREPDARRSAVRALAIDAAARNFRVVVLDGSASMSGAEGRGIVLMPAGPGISRVDLLRNALRMSPDLIAVDLLTSAAEAMHFLSAGMTGSWCVASIDAGTPAAGRAILEGWVKEAGQTVALFQDARMLFVQPGGEILIVEKPDPPPAEPTLEQLYGGSRRERPRRGRNLLAALSSELDRHRRTAWLPVWSAEAAEQAEGSKMGGRPWLGRGEARPSGADGAPLFLVLQLDLASLPAEARPLLGDAGFLQFFRSLDSALEQGPFSVANRLRVLPPGDLVLADSVEIPGNEWTARGIQGWRPVDDFPHSEDWPDLKIDLNEDDRFGMSLVADIREADVHEILHGSQRGQAIQNLLADEWRHFGLSAEALPALRRYARPMRGDKLLGWPAWEQGPEWPKSDGVPMEYLFQVEFDGSYDPALKWLISPDGRGHLFRSKGAPTRFAFPWACG